MANFLHQANKLYRLLTPTILSFYLVFLLQMLWLGIGINTFIFYKFNFKKDKSKICNIWLPAFIRTNLSCGHLKFAPYRILELFFFFFFFFFWDGEHCTSSRLRYQKEIQKELILWKWCYFIENLLIESTTLNKLFNLSVSDYQSFLLMFKTTHQYKPKFGFPCKLLGRVECCISWVLWN